MFEERSADETKSIPWGSIFETVWRRRGLVLGVTLLGSLIVAALVLSRPPLYKAKATIILGAQRVSGPRTEAMPDKQIESELALLSSPTLVREVLLDRAKAAGTLAIPGGEAVTIPPPDPRPPTARAGWPPSSIASAASRRPIPWTARCTR
ncbi:MAG: Wzz/FepE/Etk N-terminal domain-containing protein [Acidobacteriota bacterium]|nr:Wzz/FepE/Etk N-terminal domain-containing protein [Acidobacteriota bacterium]